MGAARTPWMLLGVLLVDLVGLAMLYPILPFLAKTMGADARGVTLLIATHSLAQLLSAPLWGRISDRIGRRRSLLLVLLGAAGGHLWFGLAGSLTGLFLARAFSGAMAGNVAVAQAYIADVTPVEARSGGLAKIGAAFGIAFVLGPAVGGLVAGTAETRADFVAPCLAAAGLSLVAWLLALLFLTEPARHEARVTPPIGKVARQLARPQVLGLIVLLALMTCVFSQTISIYPLMLEAEFGWGPREVGWAIAYIGLLAAIIQGGLIGPATRRFGDWPVLLVGTIALVAGLAGIGLVGGVGGYLWQAGLVGIGLSVGPPILTGRISRASPADAQGASLGAASSGAGIGRIIGPPISGFAFVELGTSAPFHLAGLLILPVIAVSAHQFWKRA